MSECNQSVVDLADVDVVYDPEDGSIAFIDMKAQRYIAESELPAEFVEEARTWAKGQSGCCQGRGE